MTLAKTLNEIRIARPLMTFLDTEQMFTAKFFYWLCLMTAFIFGVRIYKRVRLAGDQRENKTKKAVLLRSDFFLISSLLFFALFVIFDMVFVNELYISDRYILYGFLMWICWLSVQKFPRWFALLSVVLVLTVNFILMGNRQSIVITCSRTADEIAGMADHIEPGSVVYPMNFSTNYFYGNITDYSGAEKPMIILGNYECSQSYFPVRWIESRKHLKREIDSCYPYITFKKPDGSREFDYLLLFADAEATKDSNFSIFRQQLILKFDSIATSTNGYVKLYKPKL
jgi:hypothetical protein